jgi:hypothetical protein
MTEVLLSKVSSYLSKEGITSEINKVTNPQQFYQLICINKNQSSLNTLDRQIFESLLFGTKTCGPLEQFMHACSHISYCGEQLDDLMIDLIILCELLTNNEDKSIYLEFLKEIFVHYSQDLGHNLQPHIQLIQRVLYGKFDTLLVDSDFYLDFILVFNTENIQNFIAKFIPELMNKSQFIIV